MNGNASHLALVCGVTIAINTVASIASGKEAIVTVVAGGTAFVGLAMLGGLTGRYDLATAVAYVFLVAAIIMRGLPIIKTTTTLATKGTAK